MVEMAFILPIFLLLVLGIIDFGWALKSYISVTNSAREGARLAIVCPLSDGDIQDQVVSYSNDLIAKADVTVTWESDRCKSGEWVKVKAKYDYTFITPLFGIIGIPDKLTMTSDTQMRSE